MSVIPVPDAADLGVRKIVCHIEETLSEAGEPPHRPALRATAAAVLRNPWIGTGHAEDLGPEARRVAPRLAQLLTGQLISRLGGSDRIEAFGKAAVVGLGGELEHAGALIHTPYFGNIVREHLEGTSVLCFADERAEAGQPLVVPMWHKTHATSRSHYQTTSVRVGDAPSPEEIVLVVAASTGPRPHPRLGDRTTDPVVTSEILRGVQE
ncbi:amino acid synthesis family protein [Nesterenkonia sp. K-15-9-6]|uniref:amino acid synthesis family protein n=1 Tax=Nesterenkonia sp. K-15-9-6 TaxID=3093918 RepID=UPI004044430F